MADNPGDVYLIQEQDLERQIAQLVREEKKLAKAKPPRRMSKAQLAEYLADVPF